MAIGNAIQRGSLIYVYDEEDNELFVITGCTNFNDGLKGYTSMTVNIERSGIIYTYNDQGEEVGFHVSGNHSAMDGHLIEAGRKYAFEYMGIKKMKPPSEKERQFLALGLVEFELDFQKEWESVSRKLKDLDSAIDYMDRNRRQLEREIGDYIISGQLSNEQIAMLNDRYLYTTYSSDITDVYQSINNWNGEDIKHINQVADVSLLYKVLDSYRRDKLYSLKDLRSGGKGALILTIVFGVLGLSCNSMCSSAGSPGQFLLFLPAIISLSVFLVKALQRDSDESRNISVVKAFQHLTELLLKLSNSEDNSVSSEEYQPMKIECVLDTTMKSIRESVIEEFVYGNDPPLISVPTAQDLHSMITKQTEYRKISDMDNQYKHIKKQYMHMRSKIIEVGEAIHSGHRVPAGQRKAKIQLMRCPSCGGPLAKEGTTTCCYCGSRIVFQ